MDAKVFVVARIEGWRNDLAERVATTLGLSPGSVQVELCRGAIEIRVEARAMKPKRPSPKSAAKAVALILRLTEDHWSFRSRNPRASFVKKHYNPDKIREIVQDKSSPIRSKLASTAKHLSDAELQNVFEEALKKSQVRDRPLSQTGQTHWSPGTPWR